MCQFLMGKITTLRLRRTASALCFSKAMEIVIDWKLVQSEEIFYDNFFSQVEAPEWHGRNLDALRDSIVTGDINRLEPPYSIQSSNESGVPENLEIFQAKVLSIFQEAIKEGKKIRVTSS